LSAAASAAAGEGRDDDDGGGGATAGCGTICTRITPNASTQRASHWFTESFLPRMSTEKTAVHTILLW